MDRLILMRHGEARAAPAGGRDLDRALTDAGRLAAAAAGRALAGAGVRPDLVLVSPAVRTRQTWEAVAPAWPSPPASREMRALYDVPPAEMFHLAEDAGVAAVMLVAHNPGVQALAAELAMDDPRLARGFPPATLAVLERADDDWRLAFLHLPVAGA